VLQLVLEQLVQALPALLFPLIFPLEEKPNDEKSFLTSLQPQSGHSGILPFKADTSFSKVIPHFSHLYSYIGTFTT